MGARRVKRVLKGNEPANLQAFRLAQPQATWEQLRNDPMNGGMQAYADIRSEAKISQGGLCAYCEIDIRDNDPLKSRVEHFHAKSHTGTPTNWALHWSNMLAVCAGGSYKYGAAPYTMEPIRKNLSCDAHKDQLIQDGKLPKACEGWVIDPLLLPATPSLFAINKTTGELRADDAACTNAPPWPSNQHADVKALVEHTISVLNLNCDRLRTARLLVIEDIEDNKKMQRLAGRTHQQALSLLANRYLGKPWPGFFTTICLCLGEAADSYLQQVQYQG
jgi:uncharacterized protein (TIGR02646 family)